MHHEDDVPVLPITYQQEEHETHSGTVATLWYGIVVRPGAFVISSASAMGGTLSVILEKETSRRIPALLMTMSMRPKVSMAVLTILSPNSTLS